MATPVGFISDGYTIDFEIPEVPDVSVGLKGKRRPFTSRQLTRFLESVSEENHTPPENLKNDKVKSRQWIADQIDKARCEGIAGQVVEWNLVDREGNPVPITPGNVGCLYPQRLLANLMDVVCGNYTPPGTKKTGNQDVADEKN